MDSHWFLSQYAYNNSHKINRDLLKGVFEQSEKKLMETVYTGQRATNRAYSIFVCSVLLLTLSSGYFLTDKLDIVHNNFFELASLLCAIIFLFTTVLSLAAATVSNTLFGPGSEPKWVLNRAVVDSENQAATFLLNECNDYQFRIDHNKKINARKIFYVNMALYLLALVPASLVGAWILH